MKNFLFSLAILPLFVMPTPPHIPTFCELVPQYCVSPTPTVLPTPTATPTATLTPTPTQQISPTPTLSITPSPTSTPSGLKYGAYVGDGIEDLNNVNAFQNLVGRKLDVILVYEAWEGDWKNFRPQWITNAYNNGSIPMITWEPWNYTMGVSQSKYKLSKLYGGTFDTFIHSWAQAAKTTGKDFYLRPMHEMNGNWYPWAESANGNKPGDYVKAWKHIVDIFRAENATNVKFVWCPNQNFPGSTALQGLFPGDDYVDYVCIDGYNWGDTNGGWQNFTTLFTTTYNQLTTLSSKPVIIGETASAEQGGNKANWITDTYTNAIPSMNRIVLVNWFNANKEKDWRVNSSISSLNAFKAVMAK